jgi:3-hydroxyacyl-CoA dehydrogenase
VIEGGDLKKQNQLPIQIHFFFPISLLWLLEIYYCQN